MKFALASLIVLGCVLAPAVVFAQEADPPKERAVDPEVKAWVKVLAGRLADRNDHVRRSAEQALVGLGRLALPVLKEIAEGEDDGKAVLAKKAMERIQMGQRFRGAVKRKAVERRMGRGGPQGPPGGGFGRGQGPGMGPRGVPGRRVQMLLGQLNLTDEQKEKVRELHKAHMEEAQALGEKARAGEMDREAILEARMALREKFKGQMKGILDEDQYEEFEKTIDRMGQGMGPGRGQGFGPGQGRGRGGPPGRRPF